MTRALSLADANVGEERATSGDPEKLAGTVECVRPRDFQRFLVLRLHEPSPGAAIVTVFQRQGSIPHATLSLYLYGDDAEARAAESQPRWQASLERVLTEPKC